MFMLLAFVDCGIISQALYRCHYAMLPTFMHTYIGAVHMIEQSKLLCVVIEVVMCCN